MYGCLLCICTTTPGVFLCTFLRFPSVDVVLEAEGRFCRVITLLHPSIHLLLRSGAFKHSVFATPGRRHTACRTAAASGSGITMAKEALILTEENVIAVLEEVRWRCGLLLPSPYVAVTREEVSIMSQRMTSLVAAVVTSGYVHPQLLCINTPLQACHFPH